MASLLDPAGAGAGPSGASPALSLLNSTGSGGPTNDVGGFLDYLGKQIGDENLRRAGVDPDVARFWQGAVAEHPELRLPATPAAPGAGSADPYTPFDPQALIDRINQRAIGDIGMQLGQSFEGGTKIVTPGGNIARVDVRGPGNVLQDVKPMTGKAVGSLLDEHLAQGGIPLYPRDIQRGPEGVEDRVVTLPPGVQRPADLTAAVQGMIDRATLMTQNIPEGQTPPRYWYPAGAEAMHGATGQDLPATERLLGSVSVTSPMNPVPSNTVTGVDAWNQSLLGQPITAGRFGPQNVALNDILYGSELPTSRKTGAFFEDHMRTLDAKYADNLTNDIWSMRDAGYVGKGGEPYQGTPSVGEDNYVRLMVGRATRQLNAQNVDGGGWTPSQVQAALWTHAKNLEETGQATANSFNFKNGLERIMAQDANGHLAGPALLGPAAGDPQAQAAFQQTARGLLTDPLGRDLVNGSLGLLTPPGVPGGAYVAITGDGIKPSSRSLMDASSLIRATLLRQPDAFWVAHTDVKGLPSIANANVVHAQSGAPAEYAPALREALDAAGGGLEHAVLDLTPAGVRVLNVGDRTGLTNADFQGMVKRAITQAGLPADLKRARADYGYVTHDWTADPTGSGYIAALSRLPPNLQRVGDQLFAQLGGRLDAAGSALSGGPRAASGLPGLTGPWTVPGFAQAVGPAETPLPLRPWVQRPDPTAPGSALLSLLR